MSVAVVADAHLGGPGGAAQPLIDQLEGLPARGCSTVVFLGDLFHVWIGDRRFETEEVRAALAVVRQLRANGIEVVYVEGNRDFFVRESCYASEFDRVAEEYSFAEGGLTYLAVHGDGLNDRDWRYRFWRWLSKSAASRHLIGSIPASLARRIVRRTESGLARTNFKHKDSIPLRVIERYAARRLAEGYDVLLLGHFHEARTLRVGEGEVRLLDAWYENRTIFWLESGEASRSPAATAGPTRESAGA